MDLEKLAKQLFIEGDTNNSGTIDFQELVELIGKISKRYGIKNPPVEEIEDIFEEYDVNDDKELQLEEFQKFINSVFGQECLSPMSKRQSFVNQNGLEKAFNKQEVLKLQQISTRLSRASTLLDFQLNVNGNDIEQASVPADVQNKQAWLLERRLKMQESKQQFEDYKKRVQYDSQYLSKSNSIVKKNSSISSVYTSLEPLKKSNSDVSNQIDLLSQPKDFSNHKMRASRFSASKKEDQKQQNIEKSPVLKKEKIVLPQLPQHQHQQDNIKFNDINYLEIIQSFKQYKCESLYKIDKKKQGHTKSSLSQDNESLMSHMSTWRCR